MFIRKKFNKSGSCSVMLVTGERAVGKKNPITRTIKYFGSAKDKKQLDVLLKSAEAYKANVEAASPKALTLKIASDLDIKSCRSLNTGFCDVYGPTFESVFSKLDVKPNLMSKLRDLAIMRIAAPSSKLKMTAIAPEYGIEHQVDNIYKAMNQITAPVINKIKQAVYDNTKQLLAANNKTVDVLFYDLTTIYFETSTQNELRDFGFSKDGKHQHVQIMLAMIVTTDGMLIDYEEFPGSCYEGHTLIPVLQELKQRYAINNIVLVADAALMNNINLQELNSNNIKYVIAARIKNTAKEIKQSILTIDDYVSIAGNLANAQEEIKAKTITLADDCIIAYHSTKRAKKDAHDREKSLEKIQKHVNSSTKSKLTGILKKPYVKISKGCKIEIDPIKLENDKQYDGFFGIRTNIENPNPLDLLSSYRGLWQIEQTFRIAKNSLEIRPVFHYKPQRIRAHLAICYMALALVRTTEFLLKNQGQHIPHEQLHLLLDSMRKVSIINSDNNLIELLEDPPPELVPIYQALQIKWPRRFSYQVKL